MKAVKLLYIDPEHNHNKFYNMLELGNGQFQVTYGRVGNSGVIVNYPMSEWDTKYREKKRKGYNDITEDTVIKTISTSTANMNDLKPQIRELLETLNKYAKEAFKLNYTVEIRDVSEILVTRAQDIIDNINKQLKIGADYRILNMQLLKLYNTIPRKIKNVKDSLIPSEINNAAILDKVRDKMTIEQGLLDVIKGQSEKSNADTTAVDKDVNKSKVLTYLDQLGLDIEEVSSKEEKMLKDMMTDSSSKYIKAFKVTNFRTQNNFDKEVAKSKNKTTKLLFHGSRSENWFNIIKSGLVLHPDAHTTGKLFDHGIYFADVADKSLGYIGGSRWNNSGRDNDNWLAVYEVHTGNMCTYNDLPESKNTIRSSGNRTDLAKFVPANGFDSYFADSKIERRYSLARHEFIIYDEHKCTIKYLIHL